MDGAWLIAARDEPVDAAPAPRLRTVSETLAAHRSVRTFSSRPCSRELIENLVSEAIRGTSTYGNLNCASVIVTRDASRITELRALHYDQLAARGAPLILTICADTHRVRRWLSLRRAHENFANLHGFMIATIDAALLAQSIAMNAESAGLGVCFLGTTLDRCTEIANFLELPRCCVPITSLALGYPEQQPARRDRLPLQAYLHYERYLSAPEQEFDLWYRDRDSSGWAGLFARDEAFIDKLHTLGLTNYADYCTSEFSFPREHSESVSCTLLSLLQNKGFLDPGRQTVTDR